MYLPSTIDKEAELELRLVVDYDDEPIDRGDWLPADREHYERVGPFTDGTPGARELTWEEWSATPEADIDRYVSLFVSLEWRCPCCEAWRPGPGVGGVTFGIDDDYPAPGRYELGALADDESAGYVRELADELRGELEHEREAVR